MPTFFDSTAAAAEASEALRGLAHASRGFDQPAQMYGVIGDLSSGDAVAASGISPTRPNSRGTPRCSADPSERSAWRSCWSYGAHS